MGGLIGGLAAPGVWRCCWQMVMMDDDLWRPVYVECCSKCCWQRACPMQCPCGLCISSCLTVIQDT